MEALQNNKNRVAILPSNPSSGYLSPKFENIYTQRYMAMIITALFTVAKIGKQPKCPSTDNWINMWYLYTM